MTIYRNGVLIGTPSQIQQLIDLLNQAVEDAETAATQATTAYNNLNNLYLGSFATDPTQDNDSSALDGGELYHNSVDDFLYVYDGTAWQRAAGDLMSDGTVPMAASFNMAGNHLLDYTESDSAPSSTAGAITFDFDVGNIFSVALTENITSITFSNVPASGAVNAVLLLTQDATGSRTITWPASVKWAGGMAPTLSTAASSVDLISMFSVDGGTTWYAVSGGLAFS